MLGRLARWLRVLGFDTLYDPAMHDAQIVRLAESDDRVLLTRDRRLLRDRQPREAVEVTSDAPLEQLVALVDELQLTPPTELFTRCLLCNAPLEDAATDIERLPPMARELAGPIKRCPECRRLYWPGSHVRRMTRALAAALPEWFR
jgi:uncharacterized protein with PIN domain